MPHFEHMLTIFDVMLLHTFQDRQSTLSVAGISAVTITFSLHFLPSILKVLAIKLVKRKSISLPFKRHYVSGMSMNMIDQRSSHFIPSGDNGVVLFLRMIDHFDEGEFFLVITACKIAIWTFSFFCYSHFSHISFLTRSFHSCHDVIGNCTSGCFLPK